MRRFSCHKVHRIHDVISIWRYFMGNSAVKSPRCLCLPPILFARSTRCHPQRDNLAAARSAIQMHLIAEAYAFYSCHRTGTSSAAISSLSNPHIFITENLVHLYVVLCTLFAGLSLMLLFYILSSSENQKGAITFQRYSIENQKGTIAIDFVQQ